MSQYVEEHGVGTISPARGLRSTVLSEADPGSGKDGRTNLEIRAAIDSGSASLILSPAIALTGTCVQFGGIE